MVNSLESAQLARTAVKSTQSRATLESLPREIMDLLLERIPDPLTLRALVHASPLYYSLYIHRRHLILSIVLQNDMSPSCLVVARSVEEASWFLDGDFEDVYIARVPLIRRYFTERSRISSGSHHLDTNLGTTTSIFRRHLKIQSITRQYAVEKLSVNPVSKSVALKYDSPSSCERHRIYRALYNFQLYCLLFVSKRVSEDGPYREQRVGLQGPEYGLSHRYLPNITAQEVEEVACIREYLFNYYSKVWQDCIKIGALHLLQQRWAEIKGCYRSRNPDLRTDETDTSTESPRYESPERWEAPFEDQKKEYWMSLGLGFFQRIACAPGLEGQAEVLVENPWRRDFFLTKALRGECVRPPWWCSAHPFGFDHNSMTDESSRLAPWWDIPDFGLPSQGRDYRRSWGYVFWDLERIEAWKESSKVEH